MNKLGQWLKQNPMLKLTSLLLAFIIWIAVVNISNPEISDYVTVELEVRNPEELIRADQMYSLDTRTVRVSFNVRARYSNLISASDFTAYVDLKDYSVTGAVPVYIEPSSEISSMISDIRSNPMVVHVSTEDMQEKRFDINVNTIGTQAEGYALGDISLSQDYIYVNGPVSEIGMVSSVGIEVDISEATSDVSGTAQIVFYDANGHAIDIDERMELSLSEINYVQPVYRIKSLSISAGAVGEPAEGYIYDGVEVSPSFVSVYGPEELLDMYSSIEIPESAIDISGATRNVTLSIDIAPYIPEGLILSEASSQISAIARIRRAPETSAAEETEPETLAPSSEAAGGPGLTEPETAHESSAHGSQTVPETLAPSETVPASEAETQTETLPHDSGAAVTEGP